MKSR
jgi:MYXO-CTERM domain-containing protein